MCVLAEIPMNAVGGVSAKIISRYRSEALQCLQRGWFSLYATSLESFKLLHASSAGAFSIAAGASFKVNFSNHHLLWEAQMSKLVFMQA